MSRIRLNVEAPAMIGRSPVVWVASVKRLSAVVELAVMERVTVLVFPTRIIASPGLKRSAMERITGTKTTGLCALTTSFESTGIAGLDGCARGAHCECGQEGEDAKTFHDGVPSRRECNMVVTNSCVVDLTLQRRCPSSKRLIRSALFFCSIIPLVLRLKTCD